MKSTLPGAPAEEEEEEGGSGAGDELAELLGLKSGRGRGQVQERGRERGSKSGSISTTGGASAMTEPNTSSSSTRVSRQEKFSVTS